MITSISEAYVDEPKQQALLTVIGDINGEADKLKGLISKLDCQYSLFNSEKSFDLKDGHRLVFIGNYVGHGSQGREVVDVVRKIKRVNGHQVITLLGNSEIAALESYKDLATLASLNATDDNPLSVQLEDKTKKEIVKDHVFGKIYGGDTFVAQFGGNFDEALSNYVTAMKPGRVLRKWLEGLEPLYLASIHGGKVLFVHGDAFPPGPETENLERLVVKYESIEKESASEQNPSQLKRFIKNNFHHHPFRKKKYRNAAEESAFVDGLNADVVVTSCSDRDAIRMKYGRVIRLDSGLNTSREPSAVVFRPEGAYTYGVNSGEKLLFNYPKA